MTRPARSRDARKEAPPARGRPPLDAAERKRILDATGEVFLERGFERASTTEIARRARTSKQTLYGLFPTKADLFAAVMSGYTEQLFAHHMEYIESGKPAEQALTEIAAMVLDLFSAPRFLALYRILVAEAENFPELARQLWRVCAERGYTLLAEYLRSRGIGGPAWRRSAAQFVSLLLGDFLLSAMLNPDHRLSRSAMQSRVRGAVRDFLALHPEHTTNAKRGFPGKKR